eukprot:UN21665
MATEVQRRVRDLANDQTIDLCVVDHGGVLQYAVVEGGVLYPTCVQHGLYAATCDPALGICADTTKFGSPHQQTNQVFNGLSRNNYMNPECPWVQDKCEVQKTWFL